MLLLQKSVLVPIPKFEVASDDGIHEIEFSILFKRLTIEERKKRAIRVARELKTTAGLLKVYENVESTDEDIEKADFELKALEDGRDKQIFNDIEGWRDLIDVDGSEVEYSLKEKREIINSPVFKEEIGKVYQYADGGVPKAVEEEADSKN